MPISPTDLPPTELHAPLVISTPSELRNWVKTQRSHGKTIGAVPTMGALHRGHLSLVESSLKTVDATVVTIFLNPTQFAPSEDLNLYPRTFDQDLTQLSNLGPVTVFAPSTADIYPTGFSTSIAPPKISKTLEGEKRPTHFAGVATIVLKLLNLTSADFAFFGQKDFQQQLVVRQMVADLNVPTKIIVCPIVRESDGLAMSSRNAYLSVEERKIARILNQTLTATEQQIHAGQRDSFELIVEMRQMLIDGGVTSVDYAVVADPQTLETPEHITGEVVLLVAAMVGKTRLIDNRVVSPTVQPS